MGKIPYKLELPQNLKSYTVFHVESSNQFKRIRKTQAELSLHVQQLGLRSSMIAMPTRSFWTAPSARSTGRRDASTLSSGRDYQRARRVGSPGSLVVVPKLDQEISCRGHNEGVVRVWSRRMTRMRAQRRFHGPFTLRHMAFLYFEIVRRFHADIVTTERCPDLTYKSRFIILAIYITYTCSHI